MLAKRGCVHYPGPCHPPREDWILDDARVDLLAGDPEALGEILMDIWAYAKLDTDSLKDANSDLHTGFGLLMHPDADNDTMLRAAKQMRGALRVLCGDAIDARIQNEAVDRINKLPACCRSWG